MGLQIQVNCGLIVHYVIGNVQNHLRACVYSQVVSVCYSRLFVGSSGKFFQERFKQRSASEGPRTHGKKVPSWSCLPVLHYVKTGEGLRGFVMQVM